jgi:endonuclease/exonuclease/phosphatase family metal-dependent hydrolase
METQTPERTPQTGISAGASGGRILATLAFLGKTGRRPRWWIAGLVVVLLAGTWYASLRRSTGPAAGGALQGPPPLADQRETFRLGMWNIHGCVGRDGHYDAARVAKCLHGLDMVGLNEVHGWSFSASANQAATLGQLLHMGWLNAPAEQRWYCQQFGNALLTTRPIDRWERTPLPDASGKGNRNVVLVQTRHRQQTLQIVLTHLVHKDVALRYEQFDKVMALFRSLPEPAILAGDLNLRGSDPRLLEQLARPGVVDALASKRPSTQNPEVIWILLRGLRVVDAGMREEGASDHALVWAELALP